MRIEGNPGREAAKRGWETSICQNSATLPIMHAMIGIVGYYKYLNKEFSDQKCRSIGTD